MSVMEWNRKKRMYLGQDGNQLTLLIILLSIIFVLFKFVYIIYVLSDLQTEAYQRNIHDWLRIPAEFDRFMYRPWTLITYNFMHFGVFHFLGNILWLWAFGYILQDLAGNSKIIPLFLYGGAAGGIVYLLSFAIFPGLAQRAAGINMEGASAGVMAIAVATTALAPDYRIFPMLNGGIPLWVLTIIFVVVDFASIPGSNTGGHLAHLGGAAMGLIYIRQLRKGNDMGAWMLRLSSWMTDLFNPDKPAKRRNRKEEMFYKSSGAPFKKIPQVTQQKIDAILDKINQKGVHFLTDEEKEILKRASEDDQFDVGR
jgi:membrane associated rhomboid family serine protease